MIRTEDDIYAWMEYGASALHIDGDWYTITCYSDDTIYTKDENGDEVYFQYSELAGKDIDIIIERVADTVRPENA